MYIVQLDVPQAAKNIHKRKMMDVQNQSESQPNETGIEKNIL